MTGMSSPVLDRWALELQQFDITVQYIQSKQNVVADGIGRLRTLGLYKDNDNEDEPSTIDDIVENVIEEINSAGSAPKETDLQCGKTSFGGNKERRTVGKVLLDHISILRKVIKLKNSIEPAIVVPRKLASIIIIKFHNAKGHQGTSRMVNMIRCYFWWIDMQRDMHQHITTCKLVIC